ncbi:conserved exported hypothetical protein [Gammaproteobacteria bacterium]
MKHVKNYWPFMLSTVSAIVLASCATPGPPPEDAPIAVQPDKAPVRNVTSFTTSLQCMDNLFIKHGRTHPVTVTSVGIQDATGKVLSNTRDMLISSLSKMSTRSHAIKFLDFDTAQNEVRTGRASETAGMEDLPDYNLRGAISGIDQGVIGSSASGGLNYTSPISAPIMPAPGQPIPSVSPNYSGSIGASTAATSAVISVDMNVVLIKTREVLPSYTSTNQIIVSRSQKSADAGGSFLGFGVNFNFNVDRAQGPHQAVRTLVELGAIETMGKLLMVPYWQCLDIEASNPGALSQARDWFDGMNDEERTSKVQTALSQSGLFSGTSNGRMDDALRDAIGKYQAANGLIATGRIDFDLYNQLLNANLVKGDKSEERRTGYVTASAGPIGISLRSDRDPPYQKGDSVSIHLTTNRQAYVYCYYQDTVGHVARIFPNRSQSNPFINAGQTIEIPGKAPFRITMDKSESVERFACIATPNEIGFSMPENFKVADLTPIQKVDSINELIRQLRGIGGADMASEILNISVK